MNPSQRLLTKLKAQYRLQSNYQLHKILCCTVTGVMNVVHGRSQLSGDLVMVACDLLGEDPTPWLLEIEICRCKSPERRKILERLLKRADQAAGHAMPALAALLVLPFWWL